MIEKKSYNKCCNNCLKGTNIAVNNDILCREQGAVTRDYVCSKHKSMPASQFLREMNLKCIDCENFSFDIQNYKEGPAMGLCQLFSVRQFDGSQKNACSKFLKRENLEVS